MHKIKDEGYIISLHEYKWIRTHWIALYVNGDNIIYLDNFGVEYIKKKKNKKNKNKNITENLHRI